MNIKYILVAGVTQEATNGLAQWINTVRNVEVTVAGSDERAIELAQQQGYDMVIVNNSNRELNTKKLVAVLPILQPEVLLLSYEGEPTIALNKKIETAFDKRKLDRMKRMLVLDSSKPSFYAGLESFSAN
jgi:hypothetical protein